MSSRASMTKKHFNKAAEMVLELNDETERKFAAKLFAEFFKGENPRFDKNRFLYACKTEEEKFYEQNH